MKITISTVENECQNYNTVGDYSYDKDFNEIEIKVSSTGNWKMDMAVMIHELFEIGVCNHLSISLDDINEFDLMFEEERRNGKWNDEEPGDDPRSPYKLSHFAATNAERLFCREVDLDWKEYEDRCIELGKEWEIANISQINKPQN